MIDYAKLKIPFTDTNHVERVLASPNLEFETETKTRNGVTVLTFDFIGMRLKLFEGGGFGYLENSLHKFWHGNNTGNFTRSELELATTAICDTFQTDPSNIAFTGKLEIGINIETDDTNPVDLMKSFSSYRLKPFYPITPPPNFSKPLEYICTGINRNIKFYDTGTYNKTGGNNLRYEHVYRKQQGVYDILKLSSRYPLTLEGICERGTFEALGNQLVKIYKDMAKKNRIDFTDLTPKDMQFLFAGFDPEYWATLKKYNPNTCKKYRTQYNNFLRQLPTVPDLLGAKIEAKVKELTNN